MKRNWKIVVNFDCFLFLLTFTLISKKCYELESVNVSNVSNVSATVSNLKNRWIKYKTVKLIMPGCYPMTTSLNSLNHNIIRVLKKCEKIDEIKKEEKNNGLKSTHSSLIYYKKKCFIKKHHCYTLIIFYHTSLTLLNFFLFFPIKLYHIIFHVI